MDDGHIVWMYKVADEIVSSPSVANGRVYFGSKDHYVYCLDANYGTLIWRYQTGDWVCSDPLIINGRVYIGSADGYMYCLEASDGDLIWKYRAGDAVHSDPSLLENKVYFSAGNDVYCLDANDGSLIWKYETGGRVRFSPALMVEEERAYACSYDYNVYCLDANDGSLIWKYKTEDYVLGPALAGRRLYAITTIDGDSVYCFDAIDGTVIWRKHIGFMWHPTPVVVGGRVYIGCHGAVGHGYLYCLDMYSGETLWTFETKGYIYSTAAVAYRRVFITTTEGYVYCVGDATPPVINEVFPSNNTIVHDEVVLKLSVSDNIGIDRVEFYVDDHLEFTDNSPPWEWVLDTTKYIDGEHEIFIKAYDTTGNSASKTLILIVDNSPPSVCIVYPAQKEIVDGVITITVMAEDTATYVAYVLFYVDNTLLYNDTSPPWSWVMDTTKWVDGKHFIRVEAYDAVGHKKADEVEIYIRNQEEYQTNESPLTIIDILSTYVTEILVSVLAGLITGIALKIISRRREERRWLIPQPYRRRWEGVSIL